MSVNTGTPIPAAKPPTPWVGGLPNRPMSQDQQIEALRRVQVQAEQRVRLGTELLGAAEARIAANQKMLEEIRHEADRLQHQTRGELADRLDAQDLRIAQLDERMSNAMQSLDRKVDALRADWARMQIQMSRMLRQQVARLATPAAITPRPSIPVQPPQAAAPMEDDTPPSRLYADLLQQLRAEAEEDELRD